MSFLIGAPIARSTILYTVMMGSYRYSYEYQMKRNRMTRTYIFTKHQALAANLP